MRMFALMTPILLLAAGGRPALTADTGPLRLSLRRQVAVAADAQRFHTLAEPAAWEPQHTAIIICDVWDLHHCRNAVRRIEEFGPRLNEVVKALRQRGATVIHAPSDCLAAYASSPARRRAQETPLSADRPADIELWCNRIPAEEAGVYPIDQTDGGEDDDPAEHAAWAAHLESLGRNPRAPWKSQSPLIEIDEQQDYISDRGDEVWSILAQKKIEHVILAGVHTNMCVLGRPFGLRQLAKNHMQVVLLRDMTDTMYNPAMWPYVSHFEGTDRIVAHVERYVCPTISSDQILGGREFRFGGDRRPHAVLLMSEDEYETARTLTEFAARSLGRDFRTTCVYGRAEDGADLPGLDAVNDADVLVISVRRRALPGAQLEVIRRYVAAGKPVIGIRTASHAFALRDEEPSPGHVVWPEFDAQVWGGHYTGHYANDLPATIEPWPAAAEHPLLTGIPAEPFPGGGSLYQPAPLAAGTTLLLQGRIAGQPEQPVAWTFTRADGGRSFYTSLGHKDDFENPVFVRLLRNAIYWATGMVPSQAEVVVGSLQPLSPWRMVRVPGTLTDAFPGMTREATQPIWFRCAVRVRKDWLQPQLNLRIAGATSWEFWVNGVPHPGSPFDRGADFGWLAGVRTDLQLDDANLFVVRVGDAQHAELFLSRPPQLLLTGDDLHDVSSLDLAGEWEARIGREPENSSLPLPAKFALPPRVCFELPQATE